jgi:selenocysteine lyase/cysteine desulfurase
MDVLIRDVRFSNEIPVHNMWNVLEPRIESCRRDLAMEFGCDPDEMAITRNASESLETLILGIDLQKGDEVVVTTQNYPRMLTTWDQRARRDGIVVKRITFPVPPPSPADLVERFRAAITPRTRVLEVTHITNLTGQIFPVREIVRMARERNIETFVDGAHAFAHFPFKRDELDCDYYATSLHKWLYAPIGTGFLYVRKAKQKQIWPLMAAPPEMDENVRKYEEIGTHPAANHNAIAMAMVFHRTIGGDRKAARLRFLRDRWAKRLQAASPRVKVLTPLNDTDSCGIGFAHFDGLDTKKLQAHLWEKHRIMTTPIEHPEFNGLRITPNVYTMPGEIDQFCDRMEKILKEGIPA